MAMLVWAMMGIALWHFTVFIPDRFWGGIVGAFLGALFGAVLIGLAVNGFTIPGQDDTDLVVRPRGGPRRARRHRRRVLHRRAARQRSDHLTPSAWSAPQRLARGLERDPALAQGVGHHGEPGGRRSPPSTAIGRAVMRLAGAQVARPR